MSAAYKIGDRVRFLNEVGGGEVVKLLSDYKAVIKTEDGFDEVYPFTELVPESKPEDYNMKVVAAKDRPQVVSHIPKKWQKENHEIDLHIHNLMDDPRNLTNFEMVQIQLEAVRNAMKEAQEKRATKVIIIHGVGKGKLKDEVIKVLETYANIEFYDASFRKYGFGATEVALRYN